ncbi:MAG: nucleotidyltransferase domain-containing protein [Nanoarchaeota archaeon]
MQSKEERVLMPFFNSPKHWYFNELLKKTGISRPQLSLWLKKFQKECIVKRVKRKGKMPYYTSVEQNPEFRMRKRLFALKELTESGLLSFLSILKGAKVVVLFGSYSRWDWHEESDIDIFVYGHAQVPIWKYAKKIGRLIEIHPAKDRNDLKRMEKLIPYIVEGDFIKGSIQDMDVTIHAKNIQGNT